MICCEQKQEYFDFANCILDADFEPVKSRCIASLDSKGLIKGVVVASRFTKYGCELNVASCNSYFITREFISIVFHYVFTQCDKIRISVVVSEDNPKSLKMQERLGFIREAVLKNAYGDHDGILLRMLRSECKWLGDKNESDWHGVVKGA